MSSVTDRAGNVTVSYNSVFGKPFRIEYPDKTFESFVFTNKGQVKESYDKVGNVKYYSFDPSGNTLRLKEYISTAGNYDIYKLTQNTYDEVNNLLSSETFEDRA